MRRSTPRLGQLLAAGTLALITLGIIAAPIILRSKLVNALSPARMLPAEAELEVEIEGSSKLAAPLRRAIAGELALGPDDLGSGRITLGLVAGEPVFFTPRGIRKCGAPWGRPTSLGAGFVREVGCFRALARSERVLAALGEGASLRSDPDFRRILGAVPSSGELFVFARGDAGRFASGKDGGPIPDVLGLRISLPTGDEFGRLFGRFLWDGAPLQPLVNDLAAVDQPWATRLLAALPPGGERLPIAGAVLPDPPLTREEDPFLTRLREELRADGFDIFLGAVSRQVTPSESVLQGVFEFPGKAGRST